MPRVPYTPYPTEEARSGGTGASSFQPAVPDVAFGTSIARATQQAGSQLESSGNEMFSTALGLQRMANETAAKNTDVAFTSDLAKLQTQYETTEGVNAQAGLDKHIKNIQELRQKYLDSAKNPEQRLLFANSVDRRTGYAIVDAGGHAARQTKKANDDATEARIKSGIEYADVTNPEKFKAGINQQISETQAKGRDKGWESAKTDAEVRDNVSKYLTNALRKHSPVNPEETLDRFNEVKDWLRTDDRDVIQKTINRDIANKSSQTEASKLIGEDPLKAIGHEQEILEKAQKLADSDRYKDNPDFGRLLDARVRSSINMAKSAKRDTDLNNEMMIKDYVHGKDFNSKISSIDGVTGPNAPPEIRNAYNSSDRAFKDKIDAYIAKENKLAVPYTAERQKRFQELWGMSTTRPGDFAKLSIIDEDMDHGHIDQLIKRQASIAGRTADDTHINQYLSWARPTLQAAGIGPSATDTTKAKQYEHFVGALDTEIRQFEINSKAPPKPEDVKRITQMVLQQVTTGARFNLPFIGGIGSRNERRFEIDVPDNEAKVIRDRHQERNPGANPLNDDQVRDLYWRSKQFKEVH